MLRTAKAAFSLPMAGRFRPSDFDECVGHLCNKIEAIAVREGVSDAHCADLEGTLLAMPPLVRDRIKLMLEGVEIQTEYAEPVTAFAARYILVLARDIWQANPHPLTHMGIAPRSLTRPG
jgi:hypothetical protein